MPEYISVLSVRRTCGIGSVQISDVDITSTIDEVEAQVPYFLKTQLKPTQIIEKHDGNNKRNIFVEHKPLAKLKALRIGEDDITIKGNVGTDRITGEIILDVANGNPEKGYFDFGKEIKIKHDYCRREDDTTVQTMLNADAISGEISLSVDDESNFSVGDYIRIYGMDGNDETGKISSTSDGSITLSESLTFNHESESVVVKRVVEITITRLLNIVTSISLIARMVGQSYDETTGYSLGELSVQKGEPYTQWRETFRELIQERDEIYKQLGTEYIIG